MGDRTRFFVGFMASLQRTLYVDHGSRSDAGRTSREMGQRMAESGAVLLFAEGHRDIGTTCSRSARRWSAPPRRR